MEKIIFLVFLSLSDRISIVTEHFVYNKGGGGEGKQSTHAHPSSEPHQEHWCLAVVCQWQQ